jgi:hypothetical protein
MNYDNKQAEQLHNLQNKKIIRNAFTLIGY